MANFRPSDRLTSFLLPPSVDEWLPQRHLARFVVEVIEGFDLTAMSKSYRGTGSASYHPAPLLGLLVYGYATGVFSSRKLERATYDSVAFRFIAIHDQIPPHLADNPPHSKRGSCPERQADLHLSQINALDIAIFRTIYHRFKYHRNQLHTANLDRLPEPDNCTRQSA